MPVFIASFTYSQSDDGQTLTITDTSNYTAEGKGTFSSRKLYLFLSDGSTMISDGSIVNTNPATYINFSFASYPSDSIEIPISMDYGFNIVLELTSNSPQAGSVYTFQYVAGLEQNIQLFLQSMTQGTQAQNALQNDISYQSSWRYVYLQIVCIRNAQLFAVLSSIQNAIDRAYNYINHSNLYFG